MALSAESASLPRGNAGEGEVSLFRLYLLRATYLLLLVGLGSVMVPEIVSHALNSRGVIPSLLVGMWTLAFLGLRYPLQMLPLLMFEFAWKLIWMIAYGLPQWSAGHRPPSFSEDFASIGLGVILMPLVIPWGYVYRRYVTLPGARGRTLPRPVA